MTVENSELNTSGPLRSSNVGLTGGSGDGNRLLVTDLARGYSSISERPAMPDWLQLSDATEHGFLTRPEGWER